MEHEGMTASNVDSIANLSGEDIFDDIMTMAEELKDSLSLFDQGNASDNDLNNDSDITNEVKSNDREEFKEFSRSSHTDPAEDSGLESMYEMREELQDDGPSTEDVHDNEKCMSRVSSKSSCSDSASSDTLDSCASSESGNQGLGSFQEDDSNCSKTIQSPLSRAQSYSITSTLSEQQFREEGAMESRSKKLSLDTDKRSPVYSGYMIKLGGTGLTPKNWRKRWLTCSKLKTICYIDGAEMLKCYLVKNAEVRLRFVLRKDKCLYYYKTPSDKPVGAVVLTNYIVTTATGNIKKDFAFNITKGGARTYTFAAFTDQERKIWMKVISEAAKSPSQTNTTPECSIHNVSIPALSIKNPDCHGYIWKQGEHHKTWKRRYSVLKNGSLYYYKDMSETTALGVFNMHCYTVNETESINRKFGLVAIPPQPSMRTFYFAAETDTDRERWLRALIKSIENANKDEL